jgi:hypothetical protein
VFHDVASAATETRGSAETMLDTSKAVETAATDLHTEVEGFLEKVAVRSFSFLWPKYRFHCIGGGKIAHWPDPTIVVVCRLTLCPWISARGSKSISATVGTPSMPATTTRAPAERSRRGYRSRDSSRKP